MISTTPILLFYLSQYFENKYFNLILVCVYFHNFVFRTEQKSELISPTARLFLKAYYSAWKKCKYAVRIANGVSLPQCNLELI